MTHKASAISLMMVMAFTARSAHFVEAPTTVSMMKHEQDKGYRSEYLRLRKRQETQR